MPSSGSRPGRGSPSRAPLTHEGSASRLFRRARVLITFRFGGDLLELRAARKDGGKRLITLDQQDTGATDWHLLPANNRRSAEVCITGSPFHGTSAVFATCLSQQKLAKRRRSS